jgi:cellobiose transport system permease protein
MSSVSQVAVSEKSQGEKQVAQRKGKFRQYWPMYLSIAPYFIIFLAFGLIPTIFSLYLAFQKWDGIGTMQFVGWQNFYFVFTDPVFGKSIVNTFEIWIMSTIPMLFFALVLAFALNMRSRSKFMYQVCYFLPYITSTVAIAIIFGSLYTPQYGLINTVLTAAHLPAVQWLTDAWPMKWAVALIVIWRWTGYNALIYMAGLQSIPTDVYEAARIDGANTTNVFFRITIPLLRPVILFTIVTSSIGGLSLFTEPQILFNVNGSGNNGGVGYEGLTMSLYQYWQSFASYHFGFGAAISWVIFFIILAFTFLNWKLVQRGDN